MSKISDIGENYENLPNVLSVYDRELENVEERLKIKGKKLEKANSENSSWLHYYDQRRIELKTLVKFFTMKEEEIRSRLFKSYKENYSRALGEREINKYIDAEEEYLFIHNLLMEVEERYELYQSIVDAFISRNYALTNITKIRVAQLEYVEI